MTKLDSANEHFQLLLQKRAKEVFNSLDPIFKSESDELSGYKEDDMSVFYKQVQRITDKQTKHEKLNLRLTWNTLLTLQILDVLNINIKDFINDFLDQNELSEDDNEYNEIHRKLNEIMSHLGIADSTGNAKKRNHSKEEIAIFLLFSSKRYSSLTLQPNQLSIISIPKLEEELIEKGIEFIVPSKYIQALNQLSQPDNNNKISGYYPRDLYVYSKLIFIFIYLIKIIIVDFCQTEEKRSNLNPFVLNAPYELKKIISFFYDFISVLGKSIFKLQKITSLELTNLIQIKSKELKQQFKYLLDILFPDLIFATPDFFKTRNQGCEDCFFNYKSELGNQIIYSIVSTDKNLDAIKNFSISVHNITDSIIKDIINKDTKDKSLTSLQMEAVEFVYRTWENEKILDHRPVPLVSLEMGSGKTWVGCKVLKDSFKIIKSISSYTLIVCPANTITSWSNTLHDFGLYERGILQDSDIRNEVYQSHSYTKDTILIISHECLYNDIKYFHDNPPSLLIVDEFHLITTSDKILDRYIEITNLNSKIDYIVGLSGTPTQNDSDDFIKNFVFFQGAGYLQKLVSTKKWRITEEIRNDIMKTLAEKQLYFFGRDKELDKLQITEKIIPIQIPEKLKQGIEKLRKSKTNKQKILQFLDCPEMYKDDPYFEFVYDEHSNMKFAFIESICKQAEDKENIIIFSNYIEPLNILHKRLKNQKINSYIYTSESENNENIDQKLTPNWFSNKAVILTTLKKSGIGINLQKANTMIFLDLWWNPMSIIQGEFRIIRKKQTKPVNIYIPLYVEMTNNTGNHFYYPQFIKEDKDRLDILKKKLENYNNTVSKINCINKETTSRNFANDILGVVIKDINLSIFRNANSNTISTSSLKTLLAKPENQSFNSITSFENQPFKDEGSFFSAEPFRTSIQNY